MAENDIFYLPERYSRLMFEALYPSSPLPLKTLDLQIKIINFNLFICSYNYFSGIITVDLTYRPR